MRNGATYGRDCFLAFVLAISWINQKKDAIDSATIGHIQPTEFNCDILGSGVQLGDDAADDEVRLAEEEDTLEERKSLNRASRIAIIVGGGIIFCIFVL